MNVSFLMIAPVTPDRRFSLVVFELLLILDPREVFLSLMNADFLWRLDCSFTLCPACSLLLHFPVISDHPGEHDFLMFSLAPIVFP